MNHEQVDGTDVYNFPPSTQAPAMLYWMGLNYISYILQGVESTICQQVKGCELLGIKLQTDPIYETSVATKRHNQVSLMKVQFPLQVLMRIPAGDLRAEVILHYEYRPNLNEPKAPVITHWVQAISEKLL